MNKFETLNVLKNIKYKDWVFTVGQEQDRLYLQVCFEAFDNSTGKTPRLLQTGKKWLLNEFMTKSEIIQTAFKAVLTAEEHESRELFRYKGEAIFGPHFDVETLVLLAASKKLDARPEIQNEKSEGMRAIH